MKIFVIKTYGIFLIFVKESKSKRFGRLRRDPCLTFLFMYTNPCNYCCIKGYLIKTLKAKCTWCSEMFLLWIWFFKIFENLRLSNKNTYQINSDWDFQLTLTYQQYLRRRCPRYRRPTVYYSELEEYLRGHPQFPLHRRNNFEHGVRALNRFRRCSEELLNLF